MWQTCLYLHVYISELLLKTQPLKLVRISWHLSKDSLVISGMQVILGMWHQRPRCPECHRYNSCVRWVTQQTSSCQYRISSGDTLLGSIFPSAFRTWGVCCGMIWPWDILSYLRVYIKTHLCHCLWGGRQWDAFCGWGTADMGGWLGIWQEHAHQHSPGVSEKREVGLCLVTYYQHPQMPSGMLGHVGICPCSLRWPRCKRSLVNLCLSTCGHRNMSECLIFHIWKN